MADLLKLITPKMWQEFTDNYVYPTNFMGQKLFPAIKTEDLEVSIAQLLEGGQVPVMAQVHAFDSEARIGDRPNFEKVDYAKLLIKEKLNQTERVSQFVKNAPDSKVVKFVFDDAANLISRVLTRAEVANMEVLGTGKATYKENNLDLTVDYGVATKSISSWDDADHDILGDIDAIIAERAAKGYPTVRAITSSKIIGYMLNNNKIKAYWANKADPLTRSRLLSWLNDNYNINFAVNDEVYKTSANANSVKRFYPEEAITFVATVGVLGQGMYGYTPEELELENTSEKSFVTITQWKTPDPVAVWTKGSALYVPILKDAHSVTIYKHTPKA